MRGVHHNLGVGHIVDRGDGSVDDPELFVNNLNDWSDAVGGAGSGGDEVVLGRIVEVIVAAHHNIEGFLFDGCCDDHFFAPLSKCGWIDSGVRNAPELSTTISTP